MDTYQLDNVYIIANRAKGKEYAEQIGTPFALGMPDIQVVIQNDSGKMLAPPILEGMKLVQPRDRGPAKLTFRCVKDDGMDELGGFSEGNPVTIFFGTDRIFYGRIFEKQRSKDQIISVTAYDQLRYFKNKMSYHYVDMSATEVLNQMIDAFGLTAGDIADTEFKISKRVEDGATILDIIANALAITYEYTGKMYVLYDDNGKIMLKNVTDMFTTYGIDTDTARDYAYSSSIDKDTYNTVIIADNSDKNKDGRQVYSAADTDNIKKWGKLVYYEKMNSKDQNPQTRADQLLEIHNHVFRSLTVRGAFGDNAIRGGSSVIVNLNLGDVYLRTRMLVDEATHTFNLNEHIMDLKLIGAGTFYSV